MADDFGRWEELSVQEMDEREGVPDAMDISPKAWPHSSDAKDHFRLGCSTTDVSMECSTSYLVREPEFIPRFFFPNGPPLSDKMRTKCLIMTDKIFLDQQSVALDMKGFRVITENICELPSFLSNSLFRRIDSYNTGKVTRDAFVDYWVNSNLVAMDRATQIFRILKRSENMYLTQDDFKLVLYDFLATDPAMDFLKNSRDFQECYGIGIQPPTIALIVNSQWCIPPAKTVIYRIFYHANRAGDGRITLRGFKHANLVSAMQQADKKNDVDEISSYFSYKHFYVIWCYFDELDDDNDSLIGKKDILEYRGFSLTNKIVDRIFSQAARKFTSAVEGKMCYEDFVYFILSEEDKSSEQSIEYWFKCIDLDGNGILSADEIFFFYEEQIERMKILRMEYLTFDKVFVEMLDMVRPEKMSFFTLHDLKRCKLAGHFFNTLFNVSKYFAFSNHDPFLMKQRQDLTSTEWDRFADAEYFGLTGKEDD